jgi:hypothetical protein
MYIQKNRLSFVFGTIFILLVNGIFYFSDPAKHLQTSLISDVFLENKNSENAEQENEKELSENIVFEENRNGVETFFGYKAGDLDTEAMIKYAYERRNNNNKKKAGISSRSLRSTNYYTVSTRTRYKNSAPWERTATLNDKLTKEGIRKNERVIKTPQDTLQSRRKAGVRRLEPAVTKTKIRRYSLRQSQKQYGSSATTFKNAKNQIEERQKKESKIWAQNRTPNSGGNTSRIIIKNADSRKKWIDQNKGSKEINPEIASQ